MKKQLNYNGYKIVKLEVKSKTSLNDLLSNVPCWIGGKAENPRKKLSEQ